MIDRWNALYTRQVALDMPSARGCNIPEPCLGILVDTVGQAMKAKIRGKVTILTLLSV